MKQASNKNQMRDGSVISNPEHFNCMVPTVNEWKPYYNNSDAWLQFIDEVPVEELFYLYMANFANVYLI